MIGKLFDVAIIGTELAGLAAGALLVKRGFTVLVIDVESQKHQVKKNGYTLTEFPGLFFGFGQGQIYSEVFTELGIPFLEKKRFLLGEPAYQVVLPDVRLDVNPNREALFKILQAEFGNDATSIMSLLGEVDRYSSVMRSLLTQNVVYPAYGMRERYRLNRACGSLGSDFKDGSRMFFNDFLQGFPLTAPGRAFLESQFQFLCPVYPDDPTLFYAAFVLSSTNKGIYKVEGGLKVLEDIFKERIISYRGKLHRTAEIEEIDFGRVNEIKLSEVKEPVRCKKFLVSTDIENFFSRFHPKTIKGGYGKQLAEPPGKLHEYTLYIAIDANVVPVGMDENVILHVDPQSADELGEPVFVRLSPPESPEYAPAGKRLIAATALVAPESGELTAAQARDIANRMMRQLHYLIPFLNDFTEFIAYDESFALYQSARRSKIVPAIDPEDRFGVGNLPNRTPHDEVFYAGKGSLPGLGMEGEGISAYIAANLLTKQLSK
ncbi:MAG TPA: hypothetical protein PKW95_01430 [bacterium]|nr:hypothetical protein [bacterium]